MPEIQSHFLRLGKNVMSIEIDVQDSMKDIEAYIQTRMEDLPVDDGQQKEDLANKILAKSGGCFLWVHLVLHELSCVYTDRSIWAVLDEIPEGMIPFYQRTIETISRNTRDMDIVKAILSWTVYCVRPLRTFELQQAVKLNIGVEVLSMRKTIEGLCGQLVYVDKNDTVRMVHPTAREFLIADTTSEYMIPKQKGHERLAMSCLRYLSSDEMKSPRNRRFLNAPRASVSAFRDYACTAFSEHIFSAFSEADLVLSALDLFLRTNILSWIDHVARKNTLYHITRTAKNLRGYLGRRAKYLSPLGSQFERVDAWVTDLTRLVAKFGVALITYPSSIYFMIPPLCPTTSAIFKQFGSSPDGLILEGVKKISWEDCISWNDFSHSTTSLTSGDKAFAVGMETGSIEVYNQGSCQWERTIEHCEHIDILKLESSGRFLASCGTRSIKVWDRNGDELWTQRLKSRCIELIFHDNSVVGVSMNGHVSIWNLKTGEVMEEPHRYLYKEPDDEFGKSQVRAPSTASISPDFQVIALGTRKAYVCLWSLRESDLIGWCSTADSDTVTLVHFNPNPSISILAVGYNTSRLAIFDPWSQEMIHSVRIGEGHQQVASLASSPDGRTLASTDSCGTMQIWDFETLTLLYQVKSSDLGFRVVHFSFNGSRILDLTTSKLRIWEPAVLVRKTIEEDVSVSDTANVPAIQGRDELKAQQGITAMVCHPAVSTVFVGKYNGAVVAYASKTGKEEAVLYVHPKDAFVTAIAISTHDVLASGDVNGNVQVWQLMRNPMRSLRTSSLLLTTSVGKAIQQLVISPAENSILISTAVSDSIFSILNGALIGKLGKSRAEESIRKWVVTTEARSDLLLLFGDSVLKYRWDDEPTTWSPQVLTLPPECLQRLGKSSIKTAVLDTWSQNLIIDIQQDRREATDIGLLILSVGTVLTSLSTAVSATPSIVLSPNLAHLDLCKCVKYFLGLSGNSFLFIDNASWLSSVDLKVGTVAGARGEYTRHFFVPNEFVARETGILPIITPEKDVIFAVEGALAIVKNGLKFQNVTRLGEVGRRWSHDTAMNK